MNIYDFKVNDIDGNEVLMEQFKNKVLLIVNTASSCGFTPQFEGLQKLYDEYKNKDFVVLGFPCNQFKNQDSGSNQEIKTFCSMNYGVTFPMFEKIEVNGKDTHPLYKFLKAKKSDQEYFKRLLERIKLIRTSERMFYQKITDIFSECSIDYLSLIHI